MKRLTLIFPALLMVLFLAISSYATDMKSSADAGKDLSEEQLLGLNVFSKDGKEIGSISEVHKDATGGGIDYVIVSSSDMGKKHAVSLAALEINADQQRAELGVEEDKFLNAPNKTADMSDEEFRTKIDEHYGIGPAYGKDDTQSGADMPRPTHLDEQQTQRERHEDAKQ